MGDGSEEIQRILRAKNFYDILGVPKNVDEDELRRKYKKLALTCHPDKCQHPQAEEAFKALGKAWSTISDPQKRAQYDRYGEDGVNRAASRGGGGHGEAYPPEDIYDIFAQMFGADIVHGQRHYTHQRGRARRPQHQQMQQTPMQLVQVLPILLFFLVYFLFSFGLNDRQAPYSLHRDQEMGFTQKRTTKHHKIPYFVQSSFRKEYGHEPVLQQVEQQVFQTYKNHLNRRCKFEQREKYQKQQRASFYTGKERQEMLEKAQRHSTQSCDDLQNLINKFGY